MRRCATSPPVASDITIRRTFERAEWGFAAAGMLAALAAAASAPSDALRAARQVWPAFALVAGLLLIGAIADDDGLFRRVGELLGRLAPGGVSLFLGGALLVGAVSSVLNLDTAAAFLTPVLAYCARSRQQDERPLLVASILLANAGSLALPGSNLTNLIVLGGQHLAGTSYVARIWPAAVVAFVSTAAGLLVLERRRLRAGPHVAVEGRLRRRSSVLAVAAAAVLMVLLGDAALDVLGIGIALVALRAARGDADVRVVVQRVGVGVLAGLGGLAVALGTLARATSFPSSTVTHAGTWAAAGVAAVGSVLVNNLPAAAMLASRHVRAPAGLLVGLDLGPNLFVTGSLAWFVWARAIRGAAATVRVRDAVVRGASLAPLGIAAACASLSFAVRG